MSSPAGLDASDIRSIVEAWQKANLSDSQIIQKLKDSIPDRAVINSVLIDELNVIPEFTDPVDLANHQYRIDNIINPFLAEAKASGQLEIHTLTPMERVPYYDADGNPLPDAGERSFFMETANNTEFYTTP